MWEVGAPNPHVVQGSTVFTEWTDSDANKYYQRGLKILLKRLW